MVTRGKSTGTKISASGAGSMLEICSCEETIVGEILYVLYALNVTRLE